jgi:ankyrin repeat protein
MGAQTSGGVGALHMAAQRGRLLSVRSLLRHPATDPNRPNPAVQGGDTPLHIAARSGKSKVVRALLADDRINISVLNAAGTSPAAAAKDVRRLDGSLDTFWVRACITLS